MPTNVIYKAVSSNPFKKGGSVAFNPGIGDNHAYIRDLITGDEGLADNAADKWGKRFIPTDETGILASGADYATASNAKAVITYPADNKGLRHYITGLAWSYSAGHTAPSGNITIEDGTNNIVFSQGMDDTAGNAGFGSVNFNPGKVGSPNTAMIITLGGAGVAASVGKLSVLGHLLK